MTVTYEEARRWLAKIGGRWMEATEPTPPRMRRSIIVSVRSARGYIVQRHALFDDSLTTAYEREVGFRRAFVRACEELMAALA
jgi:hypothetical protein